jgi:hypothetical protein
VRIRTVYLAGGINGLSDSDANDWRTQAKALIPREIGVIDPMSRDYRGKEDENVADIIKGDLADIATCEAVIAYCPRPSWGTAMEIHHVATEGKRITSKPLGENDSAQIVGYRKVIVIVPEGTPVSPWLRHHADVVVTTLEEAVTHLASA